LTKKSSESADAPIARGRTDYERRRWTARRAEVIDTAAKLFAAKGYHGTSINDLVAATGLERGGLYHYMASKQDLLVQIHERFIHPLLKDAKRIVEIEQPAIDALKQLARALMADIDQYQDQVTVFLHEWRAVKDDPAWRDIRAARKEFEDTVGAVLKRGEEEGVFAIENTRLDLLAFLGMINYSYQWYESGGAVTADELADRFCWIFVYGVTKRPD
jgi:AcrR family transcriptional regulator